MGHHESFSESINRAARDLPEGYVITIEIEKGYGCVELIDPSGNIYTFGERDASIEDQFEMAMKMSAMTAGIKT